MTFHTKGHPWLAWRGYEGTDSGLSFILEVSPATWKVLAPIWRFVRGHAENSLPRAAESRRVHEWICAHVAQRHWRSLSHALRNSPILRGYRWKAAMRYP